MSRDTCYRFAVQRLYQWYPNKDHNVLFGRDVKESISCGIGFAEILFVFTSVKAATAGPHKLATPTAWTMISATRVNKDPF